MPNRRKDKFGEYGITGMIIIEELNNKNKEVFIDTFLMSCRIIGRNIEYCFFDYVIDFLKDKGYKKIYSEYI